VAARCCVALLRCVFAFLRRAGKQLLLPGVNDGSRCEDLQLSLSSKQGSRWALHRCYPWSATPPAAHVRPLTSESVRGISRASWRSTHTQGAATHVLCSLQGNLQPHLGPSQLRHLGLHHVGQRLPVAVHPPDCG